jgi:1-acyl-sn-glycerol-3-phosphate acyltransferase
MASGLIDIARGLHHEIHPRSHAGERAGLDSSFARDWGFDSLSRAELLMRVDRAFSVHLPDQLLGSAETLSDLLAALQGTQASPEAFDTIVQHGIGYDIVEPAPAGSMTLTAVLDWHVEHHASRVHIVHWHGDGTETNLTYGGLAERSRAVARGLRQAGLETGDRVAIMLPTGDAFFIACFGILYAGGVPTPIYPPARPAQLEEHLKRQAGILRNAGAALLVASPETIAVARLLRPQVESLKDVVSVEMLSQGGGTLPDQLVPHALGLLQYTSGSTGAPNGVALSHLNLLANIRAIGQVLEAGPADIFVSWLPLYHDMGLIGAWLGSLYFAAPLVVMSPLTFLVRPEQWLWAIHRHRATLSAAPNFAFELCLHKIEDAAIAGVDLSSLRLLANGSEAVSPATIRRFAARFAQYGFRPEAMAPVYGLAENGVGLTIPPLGRAPVIDRVDRGALSRSGSAVPARPNDPKALEFVACGHPLPSHEIRIMGPTGELGERQEGLLQFRGPSATAGYFANPAKTRQLFDGGWLNSGDSAYIAGGDVYITGRAKDIIIRAGRHIYPEEIESAIGEVQGVRKGCVVAFGTHDARAGTERLVILAETHDTGPAALSALRQRVENAATRRLDTPPEEIILVAPRTIPKTSSGKLRRAAARELFERGRLTLHPQPVWLQIARLWIAGLGPRFRRFGRLLGDLGYAAWWWSVVVLLATFLWPLVLVLPRIGWRWSLVHGTARAALWLMGIRLEVQGMRPSSQRGIIISNHASYLDGLVLSAALSGDLAFVAKKELKEQFIAGHFLKALGTIFIERADPEGAVEDMREALLAPPSAQTLVFFPEGTFTRAPGLSAFRLGAFVTAASLNLSILPVTLRGTRSILRGGQWFPRHGAVSMWIGKPIFPDGAGFSAALRLRDIARTVMLMECGEPDSP